MIGFESGLLREVPALLEAWLGAPLAVVAAGVPEADLIVRVASHTLAIEAKRADDVALIDAAERRLRASSGGDGSRIAVVAVPYMGPKAKEFARSRGLSWLDLSGNCDIAGPGLRLLVEGRPNRFASPGRPSTAFSDKGSRLTRALLTEPERAWRQQELAETTGLSAGYVSKLVARLSDDGLVVADASGFLRPRAPELLLDAWAQVYDFGRHHLERFHRVGRSGPAVTDDLAAQLATVSTLRWAATGLSAAWRKARYADHRLVTFFVSRPLVGLAELGLTPVTAGENVWLVTPRDEGVFHGVEDIGGVPCVQPAQAYVDLLAHPERASEAAADLRAHHMPWSRA